MEAEFRISWRKSKSDSATQADSTAAANGTTLAILDSQQNNSSKKEYVVNCRPLTLRVAILIAAVISVLVVAGVIYGALYLTSKQQPAVPDVAHTTLNATSDQQSTVSLSDLTENNNTQGGVGTPPPRGRGRRWAPVPREVWGSWRPLPDMPPLAHPVPLVVVAHTAGQPCDTPAGCRNKVRDIQSYCVGQLRMRDIKYNFLVGLDGNAYEGVGWDAAGNFSKRYDNCSICIAYIGNYVYLNTTFQQLQATKNILALGVQLKKLAPDYILVAHNLTDNTQSPGSFVYEQIKTLPHFTDDEWTLPL